MAAFEPGTRVRLQGLSCEELNGVVGTVLEPEDAAEARRLEGAGRVKVSHYPKALALKPEKLLLALWPDFATPALASSLLQLVRGEAAAGQGLGGLEGPRELAEALWRVCAGGPRPAAALPPDFEHLVLDSPGHVLYWLGLEPVGHELLLEACDGVWRLYQAVARRAAALEPGYQEFGGVLLRAAEAEAAGYSAAEWASPAAVGSEPSAHELWGGGRDLPRKDAARLLRLVAALQRQAEELTRVLRQQAPRGLGITGDAGDSAIARWARRMLREARISMTPSRPGTPRQHVTGYAEAEGLWIFVSDVVPEHDFNVPNDIARPFARDYARLTGEYPTGHVFLTLLAYLGWQEAQAEDGGRIGWTMRSLDLRKR